MDIICSRCANIVCEYVPYSTECDKHFIETKKENTNHCFKKCKYFNNDVVCKALQEEQNCYQCIVTEISIKREDITRLKKVIDAYELENKKLKAILGDKILKEMVGEGK